MTIQPSEQDIQERAYALWEARGCPEGSPEKDWHAAKEQLTAELDAVASPLPPLGVKAAETLEEKATKPPARARPQRDNHAAPPRG